MRALVKMAKGPGHLELRDVLVPQMEAGEVLVTMRKSLSARRASLTSLASAENKIYADRRYEVETVDPLGGGDACVAGFLTGYLEGDIQQGVRLGNAFSALQQTAPTDLPWPTRAEAEALIVEGGRTMRR